MFDEKNYKATFSQVTASQELHQRIINLKSGNQRSYRKLIVALTAVFVFFMLGCGLAFHGSSMLEGIFGENGRSTFEDEFYYIYYEEGPPQPVYAAKGERQELDQELAAKYIVPHLFEIDQTITDGDRVITAEYALIDRDTKTGAVYLKIENPPSYQVSNSGRLLWTDEAGQWYPYLNCVAIGQEAFVGNKRVSQMDTTDDVLYLTYFFTCEPSCTGIELSATGKPEKKITIDFPEKTDLDVVTIAENKIVLSPFAMKINSKSFGITFLTGCSVSLRYKNGQIYNVCRSNSILDNEENSPEEINNTNGSFFLDQKNTEMVIFFNRIIDVDQIEAVIIDDTEYLIE